MDFFAHQEQARRNTTKLVGLYILAVLALITAIYFVVIALHLYGDVQTKELTRGIGGLGNVLSREYGKRRQALAKGPGEAHKAYADMAAWGFMRILKELFDLLSDVKYLER